MIRRNLSSQMTQGTLRPASSSPRVQESNSALPDQRHFSSGLMPHEQMGVPLLGIPESPGPFLGLGEHETRTKPGWRRVGDCRCSVSLECARFYNPFMLRPVTPVKVTVANAGCRACSIVIDFQIQPADPNQPPRDFKTSGWLNWDWREGNTQKIDESLYPDFSRSVEGDTLIVEATVSCSGIGSGCTAKDSCSTTITTLEWDPRTGEAYPPPVR